MDKQQSNDRSLFFKDLPKMILLMILYSFQGLPIGLFLGSVPILFKKYMSYQEIGIILMCTLPFSLKVLWSPFVDLYYFKRIGRRKSWIIPTQVLMSLILYYLQGNLELMLANKEIYTITFIFTFFIFIITCQDIAVDSWAVEILHADNSSYGSTCQSIGQKIGYLISTSIFIALHSVDFCNKYIYSEPQEQPILTLQMFMFLWGQFLLGITFYIAFFVSEVQSNSDSKEHPTHQEEHYTLSQTIYVLQDIMKNKHIQLYFLYKCIVQSTLIINLNLGQVYLTNDLKFPAETLSFITVICAPIEILFSMLSGYLSAQKPFKFIFRMLSICAFLSSYTILGLFMFFPAEITNITIAHVVVLSILSVIFQSCLDTGNFSIIFQVCDKRVAGLYITLLATVSNLSFFVHKTYIFTAVEYFGLFIPQAVLSIVALVCTIVVRNKIYAFDDLPKEAWAVSDTLLQKVKTS